MKTFTAGDINRAEQEIIYPGGKGINVSLVLGNLHIPSKMLGFVAGFTGREIERLAKINGGDTDFIILDEGCSRINLKVSADDETAVNGMGPHIPEEKRQALLAQIDTLKAGDTLVLAGSIPSDIPDDIYEQILKRLQDRDIRVVVDATGDLLKNVIKYRPFLIKPNNFELGELFSVDLHTDEEIIVCAKQLQRPWGPRNVLVSLGGDGALLLGEGGGLPPPVPERHAGQLRRCRRQHGRWVLGRFRSVQGDLGSRPKWASAPAVHRPSMNGWLRKTISGSIRYLIKRNTHFV